VRSAEKRQRIESFQRLCRERSLSLTVQRRTVLEVVLDRSDHPTADQVYDVVRDRVPGVSRTTVYRVLETLMRIGVITKVCHPGAAVRFDPRVEQHHHLVCLHCDSIVDLDDERFNEIALPDVRARGFTIKEFDIHLRGICGDCSRKLSKARSSTTKAARRDAGELASGKTKRHVRRRRLKP
jgi:Fur family peroxide stress response transcriptional regulator